MSRRPSHPAGDRRQAAALAAKGEILRLVGLSGALKTVRLDLEAVCRPPERGKRLRGRVESGTVAEIRVPGID